MDYLSQILASPDQERTVTIKTKPQSQKESPPEMPMDAQSANLPGPVIDLMQMQARSMQPFPPAVMEMMNQPASLRELENAGSYANQIMRREKARQQNGLDFLMQMLFEGGYPGGEGRVPAPNPYNAYPPPPPAQPPRT